MNDIQSFFESLARAPSSGDMDLSSIALTLLLSFFLGQAIAWVYVWTHSSLSYSRTFTQSLVLLTMIVSLVIFVIGDQLVTAFGLIGALAIIRFRNVLKDTRDTVFVFFTIVVGMASGAGRHLAALLGAAVLLLTTVYLYWMRFGTRETVDGHLTCRVDRKASEEQANWRAAILRFCRAVREVTVHVSGESLEYVYEIRLRDRARSGEMIDELRAVPGITDVVLVLRDPRLEV